MISLSLVRRNRSFLLVTAIGALLMALFWTNTTPTSAEEPGNDYLAKKGAAFMESATPWSGGGTFNVPCEDGMAGEFPCNNVDLLAWFSLEDLGASGNPSIDSGNDSWGWTDPETGTEYVIAGHSSGATFIDISDPISPIIVGTLPPHVSPEFGHLWGDYKVYNNYMFKINEADGEGMQIFDLTHLRDAEPGTTFAADAHYDEFGSAHNIVINEDSGYAYAVGTGDDDTQCTSGGLHIVNIMDPMNPTFVGCYDEDEYTHDAQCVIYNGPDMAHVDSEICLNSNEDTLTIVDVTDKANPMMLSREGYDTASYTHQGWLTEDHSYFLQNDEGDETSGAVPGTTTYIWDVSDLDAPVLVGTYQPGNPSIDHNLYTKGNMVYEANYSSGLRIIEMTDLSTANLTEVAYFDTYPDDDNAEFNGAWNVYPYFESGVLVVTDFQRGVFLLRHTPEPILNLPCEDGMAGDFPCNNVDLLAWFSLDHLGATGNPSINNGNDSWGWTDPETGTEYAIAGHSSGATFIDLSDPINPTIVGTLPPHVSPEFGHLWGDYKVYNNYMFKINEADGEGMQIFDLTHLRDAEPGTTFAADAHYDSFGSAHNIVINEDSGYAYAVGTGDDDTQCTSGGLHMVNITDPMNPIFAGCFDDDGYTHDAQCVIYSGPDMEHVDSEICLNSNEDTLTIVDVTDKANPMMLSSEGYATSNYTHQGWLTEDHTYFLQNDEGDEQAGTVPGTTTYIWDVSNLDAPVFVGTYQPGNLSIDHNLYTKGNMVYEANYQSGLRIIEMTDLSTANLTEVAYFDTYPEDNAAQFNGAWNVYPYFESGVLVVSDFERGVFILRQTTEPTAISINELGSTSSGSMGTGIALLLLGGLTTLFLGRRVMNRKR